MSKRLSILMSTSARLGGVAWAIAMAATASSSAQAQTTAELLARRDSIQQRYVVAQEVLAAAQSRARAVPDDSLLLHGSIVRFNAENLAERERRAIARAFDAAADELIQRFGPDGSSLMDGQVWLVTVLPRSERRSRAGLVLEPVNADARMASTMSLALPLNIPAAVDLIRAQAGQKLIRSHPRARSAMAGQFRIPEPSEVHYFAYRQLALHNSSPARRCARGSAASCADILTFGARERWFDAGDTADGDRVPASGIVRESLMRYAVDVDGPALFRALRAPTDTSSELSQFLATAVGLEHEQFLGQWQQRIAQSGAERVRAQPSRVLAAMGWFALFGFVALRRRPQ